MYLVQLSQTTMIFALNIINQLIFLLKRRVLFVTYELDFHI